MFRSIQQLSGREIVTVVLMVGAVMAGLLALAYKLGLGFLLIV